jgi:hypothetical protein
VYKWYAAQGIPQIDAEIAEKGYFWMETNLNIIPYYVNCNMKFKTELPHFNPNTRRTLHDGMFRVSGVRCQEACSAVMGLPRSFGKWYWGQP